MEPVTHILTGACLARTGPNRTTAYAVLAMAIAAELPDIDTVWSLRGPVESFQHHRGITDTFARPFRWRPPRLSPASTSGTAGAQPAVPQNRPRSRPRWGLLYLWALVALLSHLLLDFTNNYGLRPFFPFNPTGTRRPSSSSSTR